MLSILQLVDRCRAAGIFPRVEKGRLHCTKPAEMDKQQEGLYKLLCENKEAVVRYLLDMPEDIDEFEQADDDHEDDEAFCLEMVPAVGILRGTFDYYTQVAYRRSNVMGLAVAVSLCETIFGRRIRSHTDMRTNDYNLILATTGCGKEACESTVTKILDAADPSCRHIIPPDVQSGNGLMKALAANPCGIWICDEFGKILEAVLDKRGNQHIKNIGNHLLKLYGKSAGVYGGAAHSDGVRNRIAQPHLTILGLATSSTVFSSVTDDQVSDGLLGRIAFWPVQDRPDPKDEMEIAYPSEELTEQVKGWVDFAPGGNLGNVNPIAEVVKFSSDAKERWNRHAKDISERMKHESESRAAIWSRVAARTMKLALVHRCARLEVSPQTCNWDFTAVELEDCNWAIRLSNWLAKIACGLVKENTMDKSCSKAKAILASIVANGPARKRDILRQHRSLTAGDLQAAADQLGLRTVTTGGGPNNGRTSIWYELNN